MVLVVGLLLGCAPRSAAAPVPSWREVSEVPLPGPVHTARDLRWAADDRLWLAAVKNGVVALEVPAGRVTSAPAPPPSQPVAVDALAFHLGRSATYWAVGAPVFAFRWRELESHRGGESHALEGILDLDVHADRLLVLGARKEHGRMAPDGVLGWQMRLGEQEPELRSVYFSIDPKTGKPSHRPGFCGMLDVGAARYLADGSFLLVPGVEPGAYLYEPSGRLRRSWTAEDLGVPDACGELNEEEARAAQAAPEPRSAWWNRYPMVDDVLPLADGAALVIRTAQGTEVRWHLLRLHDDGRTEVWPLPEALRSSTGAARLKVDRRGDRVAFLVAEGGREPVPPRLFVARLAP